MAHRREKKEKREPGSNVGTQGLDNAPAVADGRQKTDGSADGPTPGPSAVRKASEEATRMHHKGHEHPDVVPPEPVRKNLAEKLEERDI